MTQYKVGLLIPCTSRGRDEWNDIKDTYLYRLSLSTFLRSQDRAHTLYISVMMQTIAFLQINQIKTR